MRDERAKPELGDQSLLLRYQRGERSALEILIRRHESSIYNFVLRQLGSALLADEVAQQVFLEIAVSSPPGHEGGFRTRLFGTALSLCRRELARGARTAGQEEARLVVSRTGDGPGSQALEDSIGAAVDALEEAQKDVFLLREIAALTFTEIALVVGQSETTVKLHLHRALRRLQSELQGFDEYQRALLKRVQQQ